MTTPLRARRHSTRNSNWAYREALASCVSRANRWLDLGCGHQLLPSWMPDGQQESLRLIGRAQLVVGVDPIHKALTEHTSLGNRVRASATRLPFADGAFDLITANMVVEHVDDGDQLLAEVKRVLAAGGVFLFHTPNRLFYQVLLASLVPASLRRRAASTFEQRSLEDVFPTRYRMNTRRKVAMLARRHGFRTAEIRFVNSSLTFGRIGPLALLEQAMLRLLDTRWFEGARSNFLAVLVKDT